MRISLLVQREPFGAILEDTLANFWRMRHGRSFTVRWEPGRPGQSHNNGAQTWLANAYLNAIFTPQADRAVFDPIWREFARSPIWWKRPLQRTYVYLAAAPAAARWLAQASLHVTPAIPDAHHKLIVAGNHKLRLLDHHAEVAYGVLKSGFQPDFMRQEIGTRRQAAACGVPVPSLLEVAADGTWFSEQYVSGTPVNRLADAQQAQAAVQQAAAAQYRFLQTTCREEPCGAYVARLQATLEDLLKHNQLLDDAARQALRQYVAELVTALASWSATPLATAVAHGDFHPANILLNADGVWLIDWEYAARRQMSYDALVFNLHARFPQGLAGRLTEYVARGWTAADSITWPETLPQQPGERERNAHLFLLEELQLHLAENSQPPLTGLGQGLHWLQDEIAAWLSLASLGRPTNI